MQAKYWHQLIIVLLMVLSLLLLSCGSDSSSNDLALLVLWQNALKTSRYNLDFLDTYTGLPDTYGAASGHTGRWVDVPLGTTSGLVNTSGTTTPVSITLEGRPSAGAAPGTNDGILLSDFITIPDIFTPAFSTTLIGLPVGTYKVYYYGWQATSGLTINGAAVTDLSGGSIDTLDVQGTNWDIADGVAVTSGTMTITVAGPTPGLSGIQIVRVQ